MLFQNQLTVIRVCVEQFRRDGADKLSGIGSCPAPMLLILRFSILTESLIVEKVDHAVGLRATRVLECSGMPDSMALSDIDRFKVCDGACCNLPALASKR